ncbi:MAG: 4Fe-4S dicluster domain-containing protein [Prevotellaceae bacterium]|jgi:NAD-dependent dihydropyrimidine dehydrogenase PreA subunit|nr:4Fe-4S dicluster domain-containing protein [Prevotellaceae bacterium]
MMSVAAYVGVGAMLLLWIAGNLYRREKNKNRVIYVAVDRCIGCRRCVKRCSRHVLEMVNDEAGAHVEVKYPGKCTACGDCLGKCKFNALKMVDRV